MQIGLNSPAELLGYTRLRSLFILVKTDHTPRVGYTFWCDTGVSSQPLSSPSSGVQSSISIEKIEEFRSSPYVWGA